MNTVIFRDADGYDETPDVAAMTLNAVPRVGEHIEFEASRKSARYNNKFTRWEIVRVQHYLSEARGQLFQDILVYIKPVG